MSHLDDIRSTYPLPVDAPVLTKDTRGNVDMLEPIVSRLLGDGVLTKSWAHGQEQTVRTTLARQHTFYGVMSDNDNHPYEVGDDTGNNRNIAGVFADIIEHKWSTLRATASWETVPKTEGHNTLQIELTDNSPTQSNNFRDLLDALDKIDGITHNLDSDRLLTIVVPTPLFETYTLTKEYNLFAVHPDDLSGLVVSDECKLVLTFAGYGVVSARTEQSVRININAELTAKLIEADLQIPNLWEDEGAWAQFINITTIAWVDPTGGNHRYAGIFVRMPRHLTRWGTQIFRDIELVKYVATLCITRGTEDIITKKNEGHLAAIHRTTDPAVWTFYDPSNVTARYTALQGVFPTLTFFEHRFDGMHMVMGGIQHYLERSTADENEKGLCQALTFLRVLAVHRGDYTGTTESQMLQHKLGAGAAPPFLIRLITAMLLQVTPSIQQERYNFFFYLPKGPYW